MDPSSSQIWEPLPRCQGTTRSRVQCKNKAKGRLLFCWTHRDQQGKAVPTKAIEKRDHPLPEPEPVVEEKAPSKISVLPWTRSQGEVVLRPVVTPKDGPGWIYVFSLPESEDGRLRAMFKVGLTEGDPRKRVSHQHEHDYGGEKKGKHVIHATHKVSYCKLAEAAIHSELSYWRRTVLFPPSQVLHREWFEAPQQLVEAVVHSKCLLVNAWFPILGGQNDPVLSGESEESRASHSDVSNVSSDSKAYE